MKKHILAIALVLMGVMLQAQTPVKLSDLQKKDKIYYQNDQLFNGQCYEKHENGKIGLKGTIKNGMKDGVWTWWYSQERKGVRQYTLTTKSMASPTSGTRMDKRPRN